MAKRHKIRAIHVRAQLTVLLGSACAECGTKKDLEFDCIEPQGDAHHRLDTDRRMKFYCIEFALSNLQLLCGHCNARKGNRIIQALKSRRFVTPKEIAKNLNWLKTFVPAATYQIDTYSV